MSEINHYKILEIFPAATQDEIEIAYRMLLYKYHPDHNQDNQQWAHEMTSKVVAAYQCLSDAESRRFHNFQIYSPLRKKPAERKFLFFQNNQKQQWQAALPRFNAGVALFNKQKSKALEKFKEAVKLWSKFPEAIYNIGLCYVDLKNFDEAKENFNKVLKITPKDKEIKRTLRRLNELVNKK